MEEHERGAESCVWIHFVSTLNVYSQSLQAYATPANEVEEYGRKLAEWNANLPKKLQRAKRKYTQARSNRRPIPLTPMAQYVSFDFSYNSQILQCANVQIREGRIPSSQLPSWGYNYHA